MSIKSTVVFHITEGMVKFLQVGGSQKKVITAVDVINVDRQSDAQISQSISAFVKQHKLNFKESRVIILIPRSRAILRHMVFPSHKEEEIRAMIDLQVGGRIPYERDEVEIDFQVMSKTSDGYAKVAVVIIPQEIAMSYWKIFSDAHVPIHGMTISSIGLWLLYQKQSDLHERPGGIIDLDINHSEICICYKTHWLTSREIPVGFVQMQNDGSVEFLKQWELTQNNTSGEKLTSAVETVYLVSTADRAYTLGMEMTKAQENLAVKEIRLTEMLPLARGVVWPKLVTDDGVSFASLAGVGFSWMLPAIDLIPRSVKRTQEQRLLRRATIVLGVWATLGLITLGLAMGMGFFKKNFELASVEQQLQDTKHEAAKVESRLKQVYAIEDTLKQRLIFSDLAQEIYRLLPAQVSLVSVNISNGDTLSLQGISSTPGDINQFQKGLVDSPFFSDVSLDYVNKRITQQGEVDYFKITCTINSTKREK